MKGIVIFGLLFASALVVQGKSKGSPPKRDENHAQETKPPLPKPSVSTVGIIKEQTTNTQNEGADGESNSDLRRLLAPENIPNIALFFVGVAGIIIAICTLIKIERQTTAAENGVNALIDSERPWLFIPFENRSPAIRPPYLIDRISAAHLSSICVFRLKNFGRSPARVVARKLKMVILNDTSYPERTEFEPDGTIDSKEYTLPQSAEILSYVSLEPNGRISPEERRAVEIEKTSVLWFCGYIRYVDTFNRNNSPTYETRFCYRWIDDCAIESERFWMMAGPAEYNRAR